MFNQIGAVTMINLRSIPQRAGLSLATVISIALVTGVLLGFLAMSNGFRATLQGTGSDNVAVWLLAAVPATFLNSIIRFMEAKLAHMFRRRLTLHAYERYMGRNTFYRIASTDQGARPVEHELTEGINDFCQLFSHLHSHLSKRKRISVPDSMSFLQMKAM